MSRGVPRPGGWHGAARTLLRAGMSYKVVISAPLCMPLWTVSPSLALTQLTTFKDHYSDLPARGQHSQRLASGPLQLGFRTAYYVWVLA